MDAIFNAKWIKAPRYRHDAALTFSKRFSGKNVTKATLQITARGVYNCFINGKTVTDSVLNPGWTDYYKRLQYQTWDVTALLKVSNRIEIRAGKGWFFHNWYDTDSKIIKPDEPAVIAALTLTFADGTEQVVVTDGTWNVAENEVRYNNIYNGETIDFAYQIKRPVKAAEIDYTKDILIPQEGEMILEQERFPGVKLIVTPKGDTVIDFGQEVTGYVTFDTPEKSRRKITVRHFEMLDRDGNVYTKNYRSAKATLTVVPDGAVHTVKPAYTFYGFRYIAVKGMKIADPAQFTAIAVYSGMKVTGRFECSDPMINQLFHNIMWGQRGNFLDIPTDCPQRDERFGWTGDAQVFCKVASYNFDTEKFFKKWMGDLRSMQTAEGSIPSFVPVNYQYGDGSAAWADVCTILPWQMYLTYGRRQTLRDNYAMMKKWVDCMRRWAEKKDVGDDFAKSRDPYLNNNRWHFGDWLAQDLPDKEDASGATDHDYIGTAFFAYSTSLLIKAGKALGKDMTGYEELYANIVRAFRKEYVKEDGTLTNDTQTACVLALHFDLAEDREAVAKQLVRLVKEWGHLTTGFVGTPYLLHALSDIGETKLAYDLLLRKEFPSWCYPITQGATTMWERWNGYKPDGTFATADMNSFNHYAYGAVGDWMYENMAGIKQKEGSCGFREVVFAPETDDRFSYVSAAIDTVRGTVASRWEKDGDRIRYTFTVPADVTAEARINGKKYELCQGKNEIVV